MTLRISCAQLQCSTLNTDANMAAAEASVRQAVSRGAELVLLPEYSATGLLFDRRVLHHAQRVGEGVTREYRRWSRKYACWLAAGIIERDADSCYNALALFSPNGGMWIYRKRYLAFFEHLNFTRGRDVGIVDTQIGRIGLMICWDMIHTRLLREMQGRVDLLLIASAWPDLTTGNIPLPGLQSWLSRPPQIQPRKLARQLGVPVAYCNMGGRFTTRVPGLGLTYESQMAGQSAIVEANGEPVQQAAHADGCVLVGEVRMPSSVARKQAA